MKIPLKECINPDCRAKNPRVDTYLLRNQVTCRECGASGQICRTYEEAISAWNSLPRVNGEQHQKAVDAIKSLETIVQARDITIRELEADIELLSTMLATTAGFPTTDDVRGTFIKSKSHFAKKVLAKLLPCGEKCQYISVYFDGEEREDGPDCPGCCHRIE